MSLQIDAQRLWNSVNEIARFTDPSVPWTRRAFTDNHARARAWLRDLMELSGLSTSIDPAGNLVGRLEGKNSGLPVLMTGSHSDTVVGGGRFDGIVGVLAGIEVAATLTQHKVQLERPLEVIDFMSEEPSDYGISCVGSRAMAGALSAEMLNAKNENAETLAQGLRRAGAKPDSLVEAVRDPGSVRAFVELHIEQGPVLEKLNMPIGVVTHIAGAKRVAVTLTGETGHSGTVPMGQRADALVAASAIVEQVYSQAIAMNSAHQFVVATVGKLSVQPNAINAIPRVVHLVVEVRSDTESVIENFWESVLDSVRAKLQGLQVAIDYSTLTQSDVIHCDKTLQQVIVESASQHGYQHHHLASGAGHDGVYISRLCPTGMIFIPCASGKSHCAEELITKEDLTKGAQVLFDTLWRLDRRQ